MKPEYDALDAEVEIAAPAAVVWDLVSNVRRTGEWSPECVRVVPLGRMRRGCWLVGFNRHGRARWMTLSRVTRHEPEHELAWRVVTNGSEWSYLIEPTSRGCRVIEARRTPDGVGRLANWFIVRFLGGSSAHDTELRSGMQSGLQHIKATAETASAGPMTTG
jgi:hypothetical protein